MEFCGVWDDKTLNNSHLKKDGLFDSVWELQSVTAEEVGQEHKPHFGISVSVLFWFLSLWSNTMIKTQVGD